MKLLISNVDKMTNINIPKYNIEKLRENTIKTPKWLHFGAGNLFRAYVTKMQENLLNKNLEDTGIIVVESFDTQLIEEIYKKNDNLSLSVVLSKTGEFTTDLVGCIAKSLTTKNNMEEIVEIFKNPQLQMVSFTITEKGYNLKQPNGEYIEIIKNDFENNPEQSKHIMSIITRCLYERYKANKTPIALVSMDNCSANGDKIKNSVLEIAKFWLSKGFVDKEFIDFISNDKTVSFPISMIDKITPRPSEIVKKYLENNGFEGMEILVTDKNTYTSAFVNSEVAEYFVVEDKFPNGRPKFEFSDAGVYITDRETVEKTERMKVTTCLNPLHTTLAIFGCLLNEKTIFDAVSNPLLNKLIKKIGYDEALKVVDDPKILSPKAFIDEVINERFANPYIPDQPERIATDTSQKMAIRFGETLKAYISNKSLNIGEIKYIPLVYAGWFRYLMGIDDNGNQRTISPDPMLDILKETIKDIKFGDISSYKGQLRPLLKNELIFGLDLEKIGMAELIETYFIEMLEGKKAVENTLRKYLI